MRFRSKTVTDSVRAHPAVNDNAVIRRLSLVGIVGNILLTSFKLFAGIAGKSGAMVSDAVHSLSDVFATFIAFLGVKLAQRAADEEHPYGHERIECVASLILGLLLLGTGLGIGAAGVKNILSGNAAQLQIPGAIALVAAIVSIVVKESMFWYTRYYARLLNSAAFMADAWHHRSDAFSSVGSLLGIAGAMLGFPVLDAVASVVICVFILKVACDILKDSLTKMVDTSCGVGYDATLRDFIAAQEDVVCVDDLRTRMFGNKVYIDLEIQVDGGKSLQDAHAVAERVHNSVESRYPNVKHIMIHLNPAPQAT